MLFYGLHSTSTKQVALTTAAITIATALYVIQPETIIIQISVISISSGFGWAATEIAHRLGSKTFENKFAVIETNYTEYEKSSEGVKAQREMEESCKNLLDACFANSKT